MRMNRIWMWMKGVGVWMKRIRHRCGYGVHSPFAFDFITNVIYEKTPYYAYEELDKELVQTARRMGNGWKWEAPRKVRRLLFRLVNWAQPDRLLYVGPDSPVIPFLKAPRKAMVLERTDCGDDWAADGNKLDFVVLDVLTLEGVLPRWWERWKPALHGRSVLVIRGVGSSKQNRACWEWLKEQPETGISFDLYLLGIVLMDGSRLKQHYVVNF